MFFCLLFAFSLPVLAAAAYSRTMGARARRSGEGRCLGRARVTRIIVITSSLSCIIIILILTTILGLVRIIRIRLLSMFRHLCLFLVLFVF